jgi:hypothetical protein
MEYSTVVKRKGKLVFVERVPRQRKITAPQLDSSVLVTRARKGRKKVRMKARKVR